MAATASRSTRAQSPAATASFGATHERPTQATFASARYAGAVSAPMPPVGQKHRPASGAATALSQPRPPDVSAGKNFSSWKPCSCRGDLRSGDAADHAVRRDEDARTAKRADAAPDPADAGSPADNAEQHDPGPHGGVGDRRADRRNGLDQLLAVPSDLDDQRVPALARDCLVAVAEQLLLVKGKILDMDRRIAACHRSSDMSRRLAEIPGIGPLVATALVATVPDPRPFASARNFAAWIGLLPKQNSSGGKERLRWHHQAGQQIPALDADRRSAGGHPICRTAWHETAVDHQASRPPADKGWRKPTRRTNRYQDRRTDPRVLHFADILIAPSDVRFRHLSEVGTRSGHVRW